MKNPTLPVEILLEEIFTRIPPKSVGKCKCLSKLWLKNLSTSQFINSHLKRNKSHQQDNLLLISDAGSLHTIDSPIKDEAVLKDLSGLPTQTWRMVVGSCNGLVLLLNDKNQFFLVNPLTQKQVSVPNPTLPSATRFSVNQMHGFGYDISKDDYKILTITTCFYSLSSSKTPADTVAYIYSFKMGVWKRIPCDFSHNAPFAHTIFAGDHVNGVIHFLARKNVPGDPYVLATFNLADESFGVIPLPADHDGISRLRSVSVLRRCLTLAKGVKLNTAKSCIIREYGVQESSTDFSVGSVGIGGFGFIKVEPICFIGENDQMMLVGGSLIQSNLETQETEETTTMVVNGPHPWFRDWSVFGETLVSPFMTEEKNDEFEFANNTLEAGPSEAPPGSSG